MIKNRNNKIIFENKDTLKINLSNLYKDYKNLSSLTSVFKRAKQSNNNKSCNRIIIILSADLIIYIMGLVFILNNKPKITIILWIIFILLTILIIVKNLKGLNDYTYDINKIRDNEFCSILNKYNINSNNIYYVIDYFNLKIEPISKSYNESNFIKPIIDFFSKIFYLIIGVIIPNLISENFKTNKVYTYTVSFALIILLVISIVIFHLYMYLANRNKDVEKTRKLIIDLKVLKILNKI